MKKPAKPPRLKPCPFCGDTQRPVGPWTPGAAEARAGLGPYTRVMCVNLECMAEGPMANSLGVRGAVRAWNRRAQPKGD